MVDIISKIREDPWFIVESGFNITREREVETILSIGNGYIGTRNSLEEFYVFSNPGTFAAGIYENEQGTNYNGLVKLPDWTRIQLFINNDILDLFEEESIFHFRCLDLKHGISIREWRCKDTYGRITYIKTVKFVSLANKNEVYKEIVIKPENYSAKLRVKSGIDGNMPDNVNISYENSEQDRYISMSIKTKQSHKNASITQKSYTDIANYTYSTDFNDNILSEQWEWEGIIQNTYKITSLVAIFSDLDGEDPLAKSKNYFKDFDKNFIKHSIEEHISAWEKAWNDSLIIISGDSNSQRYINYAIYNMIKAGKFSGDQVSIPARDLAGEAYKGHVFWDSEIYLLPFFDFTQPEIARELIKYRYNTLSGARTNAKMLGRKGADYAWESTDSGIEMSPKDVIMPNGEIVPIYSGDFENHISPDIAYAIWQYWLITQDNDLLFNYGAEIIFETARFSRSILKLENDDLYHTIDIEGPDEYHERVKDNTYTNVMIQYNLEIAVKLAEYFSNADVIKYERLRGKIDLTDEEIKDWDSVRSSIYMAYDPRTHLFEQFKDYFNHEYIEVKSYEPRTAPMDVILGRERTIKSQVIKQADVLMFLFLLANRYPLDVIKANYDYYEPRTGHGSSLSPGVYSIISARIGYREQAFSYFLQNAEIDLGNKMGNAAGGIHIGAHGALWMTVIMGFAGLYIYEDGLTFNPHLPFEWESIIFQLFWRKQKINIQINQNTAIFKNEGIEKVKISIGFDNWLAIEPNIKVSASKNKKWEWNNEKR